MLIVINYGMGNLKSISNALKALAVDHRVTADPEELDQAGAIILPGVGAFGDGMDNLNKMGLMPILKRKVIEERTPYLGICLGMQFLADRGHEHGLHQGFGWIAGEVMRLTPQPAALKVPHIGWNDVVSTSSDSVLMTGLGTASTFYFVHSYHLVPFDSGNPAVTGVADYGGKVTAIVEQGHIFGVQFHPEKSQGAGLTVLRNFVDYVTRHA